MRFEDDDVAYLYRAGLIDPRGPAIRLYGGRHGGWWRLGVELSRGVLLAVEGGWRPYRVDEGCPAHDLGVYVYGCVQKLIYQGSCPNLVLWRHVRDRMAGASPTWPSACPVKDFTYAMRMAERWNLFLGGTMHGPPFRPTKQPHTYAAPVFYLGWNDADMYPNPPDNVGMPVALPSLCEEEAWASLPVPTQDPPKLWGG